MRQSQPFVLFGAWVGSYGARKKRGQSGDCPLGEREEKGLPLQEKRPGSRGQHERPGKRPFRNQTVARLATG